MSRVHSLYRRSQDGKRWVRNKEPPQEARPDTKVVVSDLLLQHMEGEAKGDLILAILIAVRNLLQTQDRWCPVHRAETASGIETETTSPHAQRWSLFGALHAVTSPGLEKMKPDILQRWKAYLPKEDKASLGHWEVEEGRRHSEVIRLLNKAVGARKVEMALEPAGR